MHFEFSSPTGIIFGRGKFRDAGRIAQRAGKRMLIVTGGNVRRAEPLFDLLREHALPFAIFSVAAEPTLNMIREGTALAKEEGIDAVIGFGGGSVLDAAKAISIMATNDGDILDYLEV